MNILGALAVVTIAVGASLYAISFERPAVTRGFLFAGGILLVSFAALNARGIVAFFRQRSARYGANMIVMILLYLAIVIVIQALSARHSFRVDLTRNKRFSPAPQTTSILHGLARDVRLYGFYKNANPERMAARDLLEQFSHTSDRVRYELIDPDRSPARAAEMGVAEYGTVVVESGDRRELVKQISEEALANAILKLTRAEQKLIYFVRGHGEKELDNTGPPGYSTIRDVLRDQNYRVEPLSLFDTPEVPADCDLLVVAGPTADYFDAEITKITNYLAGGKNALFLLDPQVDLDRLENLLVRYRILVENTVVVDPYGRIFGADYTVPVVTQYVAHRITDGIDVATFYPMARSVRIAAADIPGVTVQYLAQTGKSAWGETDLALIDGGQAVRGEDDTIGPVSIALIATKRYTDGQPDDLGTDESQIVVFGDSDFAANGAFQQSANGDLILNAINYLAEEKDLIAIRPKRSLGDRLFLTASQGRQIFFISVVLLPALVVGVGVSVFVQRRKQDR